MNSVERPRTVPSAARCLANRAGALCWLILSPLACDGAAQSRDAAGRRLPDSVDMPLNARGQNRALSGVTRLLLTTGTCSGVLVDVGGDETAPVYALSAGHCLGKRRDPNLVTLSASAPAGEIWANDFQDTQTTPLLRKFALESFEYSALHGVDIAIARTSVRVADVRAAGIELSALAETSTAVGAAITAVGHPWAGPLLRSRCRQGQVSNLLEGELLVTESRNDCAGIAPGSSGSPIFDADGRVSAIIGTMSGHGYPCTLDNPCETDDSPPRQRADAVYASSVVGLARCFPNGSFELTAEGCSLPRPPLPTVTRGVGRYTQSHSDRPARWNADLVDAGLPYYRFKTGPIHTTRCDEQRGYGEISAIGDIPRITDALPPSEGVYVLCVHGGAGPTLDTFTALSSASATVSEVDNTAPALPIPVEITQLASGAVELEFLGSAPEYARFSYHLQSEPECVRSQARSVEGPAVVTLQNEEFHRTLCLSAEDAAGNASQPVAFELW